MSGFLAILNTDGRPCDPALLGRLQDGLRFRGPDGAGVEVHGHVGLAATLFRTTFESERETQPFSFEGAAWIVADCRLDDRERLVKELRDAGRDAAARDPDVQLLLHGWHAWGEECVQHLLGDFAFVVWDERRQTLFAARDHFGVRQLYFADLPGVLLLSNTMSCLRRHPAVSLELNERTIGDFLLFGLNQNSGETALRDVRRVPGGHRLLRRNDHTAIDRYWRLPEYSEPLRSKPAEIVDRFRSLMRQAAADRLRVGRAAISLSGGVDSSVVAAAADEARRPGETELIAWTFALQGLLPADEEASYASQTAQALRLPHHVFDGSRHRIWEDDPGQTAWCRPGPSSLCFRGASAEFARRIAATSRVVLTGEGGDAVFGGSQLYFLRGLAGRRCLTVLGQAVRYGLTHGELPPLGIRSRLKQWFGLGPDRPRFPEWIDGQFARRTNLTERWSAYHEQKFPAHVLRPEAYYDLSDFWENYLEQFDADFRGTPGEYRHPLFDVRVVQFLLQAPPIPWFGSKTLPRAAWSHRLPPAVVHRKKAPLAGDRLGAALRRGDDIPNTPEVLNVVTPYVSLEKLVQLDDHQPTGQVQRWLATLPISFALWLGKLRGQRPPCQMPLKNLIENSPRNDRIIDRTLFGTAIW